ncbi:DNA/RNA non-specific endonuclease [Microbacterium natoriense]|uniref:DNA/RNA non-specific endonuclease n=1 Tax=Microbacterium natoriense TaxID=284570 RepID=UPI003590196D
MHDGRLTHDPNTRGKLEDDHAGHLAGDLFGGSKYIDNLVSQLRGVNLSTYCKIEIEWFNALDPDRPGGRWTFRSTCTSRRTHILAGRFSLR